MRCWGKPGYVLSSTNSGMIHQERGSWHSRTQRDRKPKRFSQQRRRFRSPPYRNTPRNAQGSPYNRNGHSLPRYVKPASLGIKGVNGASRKHLSYWECVEPHLKRHFPRLNGANKTLHSVQEASMVGEIGKNFHRINAASEDQQADHQSTIVEIEDTVSNHTISVLIDPGATLSYISPRMVELCQLTRERNTKPWLVQLATGAKRKVTYFIVDCEVRL